MRNKLLTVIQTAAALGVDKQTVYRKVWAGELPYVNVGSASSQRPRIRIREDALDTYLASRERQAA